MLGSDDGGQRRRNPTRPPVGIEQGRNPYHSSRRTEQDAADYVHRLSAVNLIRLLEFLRRFESSEHEAERKQKGEREQDSTAAEVNSSPIPRSARRRNASGVANGNKQATQKSLQLRASEKEETSE